MAAAMQGTANPTGTKFRVRCLALGRYKRGALELGFELQTLLISICGPLYQLSRCCLKMCFFNMPARIKHVCIVL